jgi:DNA-directed RNA polymerase subunit K/omega
MMDLGPIHQEAPPDVVARLEERRELFRLAAVRALQHSNGGKRLEPEARRWAEHWAAQKPLGRALSDGVPG